MTDQTPPQGKPLPPLLNTEREHQMVFNEGIGVLENYASKEWCKILIDAFEMYNKQKLSKNILNDHFHVSTLNDGGTQFAQGNLGRKDEQLFLEVADTTLAANTNAIIGSAFESYVREYQGVTNSADPVSSWTCKIQKTTAGGGYHVWHCEHDGRLFGSRLLLVMCYLNDVEEGGETEFLYQSRRIKPKQGTIVICPSSFTHTHRGNPPLTGDKYMINGWIEFDN